jgi:hypothetical protein
MTTRILCLFLLLAGAACSDPNLLQECVSDEECPEDLRCIQQLCSPPECATDEIVCGGECINPRIELEFCGGCDGCPTLPDASPLQCVEGQCVYRCDDGFVDVNDDIDRVNGDGCECQADGPEVCDGRDNDCDGLLDGEDDDLTPCPSESGATGACEAGSCALRCAETTVDVNGDLGTGGDGCECTVGAEVCDGADNDCDGAVDDEDDDLDLSACPVVEGAEPTACAGSCVYMCAGDFEDPNGDLQSGPDGDGCECSPAGEEVCDGVDNDCDGDTDDQDEAFMPSACALTQGVCAGSVANCVDGQSVDCPTETYDAQAAIHGAAFQPDVETICDEVDNNCDGDVDELCCGETVAHLDLTTGDGTLGLVAMASNSDGSQSAILLKRGTSYQLLLVHDDGRHSEPIDLGGDEIRGGRVALHHDPSTSRYFVSRTIGPQVVYTRITEDGTVVDGIPVTVDRQLEQIRTVHLPTGGQGAFLIVGLDGFELFVAGIRGEEVAGLDVLREEAFGRVHSVDSVAVDQDRLRITAEVSDSGQVAELNRELLVATATLTGATPSFATQDSMVFPKISTNEVGRRSRGSVIAGDWIYRVIHDAPFIRVVRQELDRGPNAPVDSIRSFEDEVTLRSVHPFGDDAVLVFDVGDIGQNPYFFDGDLDATARINLVAFTEFQFGEKRAASHLHGVTVVTHVGTLQTGKIVYSVLNHRGEALCTWD